ncbi:MAG: class I adenylate-forming enzyme family protein [Proteobacteria bacterium]|nr:class I adenylate-forming enzyme family protein [Pseudomonadota bacterium]
MPAHLLIDYFEKAADRHPDRAFIILLDNEASNDKPISYARANTRASAYARQLSQTGIGRGDVVAILGANSINWVIAYLACQKLGAAANPINPELSADDITQLFGVTSPKAVMTTMDEFAEMGPTFGCPVIHVGADGEVMRVDGSDRKPDNAPFPRDPVLTGDDTMSILFTSGTTAALPKAVVNPIGPLMTGIEGYRRMSNIGPDDRVMVVTPLFHAAALNWAVTMVIFAGGTMLLTGPFSASRFWAQARRGAATVLWTLGAIPFILLRRDPDADEAATLDRLRLIFAAGGGARSRELRERWGSRFQDGWGMSETVGTMTDNCCFEEYGTHPCIGMPVPGMEMAILDLETGAELGPLQTGEIAARYGMGFKEYLGNSEAMESSVRNGWFHTGDVGYRCAEGRYYFVDRIKDIIRRGGENIASISVESAVASYPGIVEVHAVAKPDPELSERVCLFLVMAPDAPAPSLDALRDHCSKVLPRQHLPEDLRLVAETDLPRTPSGRVQKVKLKQQLRVEAQS